MRKDDKFFKEAFKSLNEVSAPDNEQKNRILNNVMLESAAQTTTQPISIIRLVTVYPWRFAFGAAFIQTVVCTLIFGSQYTNFILGIIGG